MILVGGIAPAGYAWAFPRGETRVRVGVGVIQPDVAANPRELYAPLEQELADELRGSSCSSCTPAASPARRRPPG